jgi:hypothetical protein
MALAALALMLQVMVPQGFMLGGSAAAPGLVICTGHGPLLGHAGQERQGKAPKTADAACPFAVHGGSAAPPATALLAEAPFRFAVQADLPAFDLAPGLGLAAPPPPSQAPPIPLV